MKEEVFLCRIYYWELLKNFFTDVLLYNNIQEGLR